MQLSYNHGISSLRRKNVPLLDLVLTGTNETLDPRITFSRTSNATQFDSAGNLVYAPHNLLTFSESFDNAAWDKYVGATVTANVVTAPDGTITADTAAFTFEQALRRALFPIPLGATLTFSAWVKKSASGGASNIRVTSNNTIAWNTGPSTIFALTNNWQRISASVTLTSANNVINIYIGTVDAAGVGDANCVGNVDLWGAQLNVGALQPYYCTTVENALGFTQEFNNAAFVKTNATVTAGVSDPFGRNSAFTLTATANNGAIQQAPTVVSGTSLTGSIWIRRRTGTGAVNMRVGDLTPLVLPVTSDWVRVSQTATPTSTAGRFAIVLSTSGDEVDIYGAQLSDSASLDPYVYNPVAAPTAAAYYGPRFDYDPATLAARGLLVEEQRTNSIRNNTMQGAVAGTPGTLPTNWQVALLSGLTIDVAGVGTENGISYADFRIYGTATGTSSSSIQFEQNSAIAASSGQTWTLSPYVKVAAGSSSGLAAIRIGWEERAGSFLAVVQSTITPQVGGSLAQARLSFTGTNANASTTFIKPFINFTPVNGAAIDITLRIGLPQLELGAFATSVIPTTTAAATRTADVATMVGANFSNWYNASEGTIYGEVSSAAPTVSGVSRRIANINNGTENNRITIAWAGATGVAAGFVTDGGVAQAGFTSPSGAYPFPTKVALAYKVNDFQAAVNGAGFTTDTSGTVPVVDRMTIGDVVTGTNGTQCINGHIRRIAFYPRRLAGTELQGVTA